MKNALIFTLWLVVVGCVSSTNARPQSSRYALSLRDVKGDETYKTISLQDKKLNRILWTRKVYRPYATWSQDKRAIAVEGMGHFLVWREGHSLRNFAVSGGDIVPGGYDYTMGCVWSPDNQRLLVRFGLSGMYDVDAGRLFCLRIGRGRTYKYSHIAGGVREMKWRDSRTVLYRLLNYETGKALRQYSWRIR